VAYRVTQIATVLRAAQRQRGVSIPMPAQRGVCDVRRTVTSQWSGRECYVRHNDAFRCDRPVSRGRVTRRLPAADIAENLKYFSLIPHSLGPSPRYPPSSPARPTFPPPPTIKLTKGNIKLNYARSTARGALRWTMRQVQRGVKYSADSYFP